MRILGIDFGDSKIGLAVSDRLDITAQPLPLYRSRNRRQDAAFFRDLIARYQIRKIVIGLPLRMDGTPGSRAEITKEFGAWLERTVKVPVVFWDERLTTRQADRILHEKKAKIPQKRAMKDPISATLILSAYLESERSKLHDPENS